MVVAVPRVDISSLSLGSQLGSGGQGRVVAVNGFQINGQWAAALKVYYPTVAAEIDTAVLEKIVALPSQLADGQGRWLLENTAWPAVIAEDRGIARGFLMRAVPRPYYFNFQTTTQGSRRQLADMAFLLNTDGYLTSSGLAVSDHDRLMLLASVAGALSRLHTLGAAVGDFSPKNILFSLTPTPRCFLIDCDAVQLAGESVFRQIETPDWEAPHGETKATTATDAYKFGLLAIRLFARDQSCHDPAALTALSGDLGHLAQRSLDRDPSQRPQPSGWASALATAAMSASTTPPPPHPTQPAPHQISVPAPTITATTPPPRRKGPLILAATTLAALITILITITSLHTTTQASLGSTASQRTPAAESPQAKPARGQAAAVSQLLSTSSASRRRLATAVADVSSCSHLPRSIAAIKTVAGERRHELAQASSLATGALAGGAALKSALVRALNHSLQADTDFLRWAREQLVSGCGTPASAGAYRAGVAASKAASAAKNEFVQMWNPIAARQGFPARSQAGI